jgi:hypothetical protein
MQAVAVGRIKSIEELRQVVRNSFELITYQPHGTDLWDRTFARFCDVAGRKF